MGDEAAKIVRNQHLDTNSVIPPRLKNILHFHTTHPNRTLQIWDQYFKNF